MFQIDDVNGNLYRFVDKFNFVPSVKRSILFQDVRQVLHHLSMVKAKDLSDSVDGKYSLSDAKEEADRGKKTSIKIVSFLFNKPRF